MSPNKERERPDAPWTTPGTDQPEKRPGPFAQNPSQNPSQAPSRTPPTKEQRERDDDDEADDKMDAVVRDAPL